MINGTEEYHSNKLKEIIKKSGIEMPSDQFTGNVMKSLRGAVSENLIEKNPALTFPGLLIGISIALLIAALIYFFMYYGNFLLVKEFDPIFTPVLKDFYQYIAEIFNSFRVSSITIVIIGGCLVLIGLDYFFRRLNLFRKTYFII